MFEFFGGCEGPASPGCLNCVSAKLAGTRQWDPLHTGVTDRKRDGRIVFNGKLKELPPGHPRWNQLLDYRGAERPVLERYGGYTGKVPSLIWIGGMTDVFSAGHRTAVLDRALATVFLTDHIALLLTKRPERMAAYFATRARPRWQAKLWLGFSAEDQKWFDQRWHHMRPLADAGWTIFVSLAPLLGPEPVTLPSNFLALGKRAWVIVNGEEKVKHKLCRDMDPNLARGLRDQCAAAGVPFFMKGMSHDRPIPPDLLRRQVPAVRCCGELNPLVPRRAK
jgi:protein gp37